MTRLGRVLLLLLACAVLAAGCHSIPGYGRITPYEPAYRPLDLKYSVAVMPLLQPRSGQSLIKGDLPERQGLITGEELAMADSALRATLIRESGGRAYSFVGNASRSSKGTSFHYTGQPGALKNLAAIAKKSGADFLLVPQVIDWHARKGSELGADDPAEVWLEFYLIRSDDGTVHARATYHQRQEGLADNLLNMKDFVRRRGAWVSATQLAEDGYPSLLRQLGLLAK